MMRSSSRSGGNVSDATQTLQGEFEDPEQDSVLRKKS
ncbi:hypothetical protein KGM_205378 [Danaus plexippus plexippus]|uniref:Uncharacterized protein n=1 Tax=Danaus plexippus plexippus TaxID=278856 RepID=A0A212FM54_DANPL|nr:hypothetical protein KGM_205378 [Danaus plexippus plexippus]